MRTRALLRATGVLALLWPATAGSQRIIECSGNPDQTQWFVRAGADRGAGTRSGPFGSLADVERCAPAGATITVLAAPENAPPLDGGIKLKHRQKLFGIEPSRGARPAARVTNTTGTGDAITLAHGNEVAHLHIDSPAGSAILGDNVKGAILRDLLITRRSTSPPSRLDPALCRVVKTAGGVDNAQSVLRGCTVRQIAIPVKNAVMLLADDRAGAPSIKYMIQRVVIQDNPSHDKPEALWPVGVSIITAGHVEVTLDMVDSSIEFTVRGLGLRALDRATLTANVTNTWFDSLRSDGIGIATGLVCSGLDQSTKVPVDCSTLAPAPLSDARVLLNADRFRFSDKRRHGQPNDPAAIETVAFDQGRSTIEVHVERSDLIGGGAPAVFTYYVFGRPRRDIVDLGCVNPAPDRTAPDREACRRLGYTSAGGNRIFGNAWNGPSYSRYVEVALQGAGRMIAQGNYWGDITPADGKGDVLGDCSVFEWSGNPKENPPPSRAVPEARCELYNIPAQGSPSGIDGRFHLVSDPRPPK